MRKLLILPMLTEYGPGEVAIDAAYAAELIPVFQEFVEQETERAIIDLLFCERCEIYVVRLNDHECEGVQ